MDYLVYYPQKASDLWFSVVAVEFELGRPCKANVLAYSLGGSLSEHNRKCLLESDAGVVPSKSLSEFAVKRYEDLPLEEQQELDEGKLLYEHAWKSYQDALEAEGLWDTDFTKRIGEKPDWYINPQEFNKNNVLTRMNRLIEKAKEYAVPVPPAPAPQVETPVLKTETKCKPKAGTGKNKKRTYDELFLQKEKIATAIRSNPQAKNAEIARKTGIDSRRLSEPPLKKWIEECRNYKDALDTNVAEFKNEQYS